MKKKLNSKKGFSLAEALVAVAILAIFVSMAAVGTSGLFGTGEQMMAVAKAAVLGSDVMQVITNELRYGEEFSFVANDNKEYSISKELESSAVDALPKDVTKIKFNSSTYGDGCVMTVSTGDGTETVDGAIPGKDGYAAATLLKGNLIFQKTMTDSFGKSTTRTFIPLSTSAYDEVYISKMTFSCQYNETKAGDPLTLACISVLLEISGGANNDTLWSNSVSINPLYLKTK